MSASVTRPLGRLISAIFLSAVWVVPVYAARPAPARQSQAVFSTTQIENSFPVSLTFRVRVQATAPVTHARFYYTFRNEPSLYRNDLEITPARELDLAYTLETSGTDVFPSTPIFYYWRVTLEDGEILESEQALTYYDDNRFDWQVREHGQLSIWWHDRKDPLGQKAIEIASTALDRQEKLFKVKLDFPIHVIIYNDPEEFAAWHAMPSELYGGQAHPQFGITTQIVEDEIWQDAWLKDVLPHEISHLYFYQAAYNVMALTPSWLDEGVAQYNEFSSNEYALEQARRDILDGKYIPLRGLAGSFGLDEEKFGRSYDESLSAVKYLIETYGQQGLSDLLAAHKAGIPTERAFPQALGVTLEEFEYDWLASLGVPAGMYPTPTAEITPASLSLMLTQRAEARTTPTALPTFEATATPPPGIIYPGALWLLGLCACLLVMAALALIVWLMRSARAKRSRAPR